MTPMDPEPMLEVWRVCGTIPCPDFSGRRSNVTIVVATGGGLVAAINTARAEIVRRFDVATFTATSANKIIAIDVVEWVVSAK